MRWLPRTLPLWSIAVMVPAFALFALIVGAIVDAAAHSGEVPRNVSLAGGSVGGLGPDDLDSVIADLSGDFEQARVELVTPDGIVDSTTADLGLRIDGEATREAVLDARDGQVPVLGWMGSWFDSENVPLRFTIDETTLRAAAGELVVTEPVDPSLVVENGVLKVDPGAPGQAVDADALAEVLPDAAASGVRPIQVQAPLRRVAPEMPVEPLNAVVNELDGLARAGVRVQVGEQTELFSGEDLARWFVVEPDGSGWSLEAERTLDDLVDRFEGVGSVGGVAAFEIVDDEVRITSAEGGEICCDDRAPAVLERVLKSGGPQPVEVPLRSAVAAEARAAAEELGIVELVGEFTTEHQCCENRVENIHRIADLVRGYVIEPGEELSINEFIGRRTREKGFVAAGVIENGVFESDVGGGISQFATTLFNAAFFGGLDFGEYQSHSIYISRYPYGREATLSYPHPDLQVINTTDYGVLVWPTYTDTTITVQLWSTKHIDVEETGQTRSASGACTRVTTFRGRTYPDGEVVDDTVTALYRPGEGLDCNGNPTVPPPPTAPPATTVPPETTVPPDTTVPTTGPPATPAPTTAPPATPAPTTAPPATPAPTTAAPPPPPTTAPAPPPTTTAE